MEYPYRNWLESVNHQIDFYAKGAGRKRYDDDLDWNWWKKAEGFRGLVKRHLPFAYSLVRKFSGHTGSASYSKAWLNEHSAALWNTRELLEDDLSKLLFDNHLILKATDHTKYYFPRIDFADLITITNVEAFRNETLPDTYGGFPIKVFDVTINRDEDSVQLKLINPKINIDLLNKFRQYFSSRNEVFLGPVKGDIVFDCGACIGEVSTIFAGLVGASGEVHTFDPIPLHSKFINLHVKLNQSLTSVLKINELAVDKISSKASGGVDDSNIISPGGLVIDNFESTSLDEYATKNGLQKIDYIKMDIEGYELNALEGAKDILSDFQPKLAICGYHKPEDLWEIPLKIKECNPKYKLYFGHHTPVGYESVFYAI